MTDFIKPFDGFRDVSTWLKKVELVAKIKNIKDVKALIPLYLDGTAFAVYEQLSDEEKDDAEKIKEALTEAFGQSKFSAYDSFRQRSWVPGEAVDVFLSDLRRLARLAGVHSEELIRCAFVCGLPVDVSSQLRTSARILEADMSTIVSQARVLMDERVQGALVARVPEKRRPLRCYECGGDHHIRNCKQSRRNVVCWHCSLSGHIARNCPSKQQLVSENGSGKLHAPTAFPEV